MTCNCNTPTALDKVVEWNIDRNLTTFDLPAELRMLDEELRELIEAVNNDQRIDALNDIIVLSAGAIHKLGYSPELSMLETIKEISSRKGTINPTTGKWEKLKDQDTSTLYKANYGLARY